MEKKLLNEIKAKLKAENYRFTLHSGNRMIERHIAVNEVEEAILDYKAEIVEDYPQDPRGPSCLILGKTAKGKIMHVQCSYPPNVAIITAYEPEFTDWVDWRTRRGGRK